MNLRRKLPFILVTLLLIDATTGIAQTKRRSTSQRSTTQRPSTTRKAVATPQPTPESRIPTGARKLKPSGAIAAFMVTAVQAGAAPGTGTRRSTTTSNDPEKFKDLFDRAVIYPRDVGARIVLNSKDVGIDYIEIRGSGKGFGVNTAEGKTTLLVNNFKFPRIRGGVTSGTVEIDIDAEMANAATPEKKVGSRLKLTAAFIEDVKNTRVFNVPESDDADEPKKTVKSDTEAADPSTENKKPSTASEPEKSTKRE